MAEITTVEVEVEVEVKEELDCSSCTPRPVIVISDSDSEGVEEVSAIDLTIDSSDNSLADFANFDDSQ